jgi:hypothetical protein
MEKIHGIVEQYEMWSSALINTYIILGAVTFVLSRALRKQITLIELGRLTLRVFLLFMAVGGIIILVLNPGGDSFSVFHRIFAAFGLFIIAAGQIFFIRNRVQALPPA